ncbi:MAG: alanine--glyoxylate aminotransferase family protein [Myxococcales bacterium]|jgi:alanine-glyoxylate transaminase/serine-glyoxylate transaminase/serine-pyruvate transaminase|nr:alanine--glyoxylate aminotransferase family protein [Myxococcales bacterium]
MSSMLPPPATQALSYILPSEPLLLMGAGPVPIPHAVARANGVVINHLGETMDKVIAGVKAMARYAFQTESEKVLGVGGPSSGAMEMAMASFVWPGRRVLCLKSGTFSGRLGEMARGLGGEVTTLEPPVATPITAKMVEEALSRDRYDVVTIAQGETSCGLLNVELPEICAVAQKHGALMVVDAVCTLTTMPMQMDEWGIDAAVTGGQKGLSSIPGVSLIAFSERAFEVLEQRPSSRPHWCFDAKRAWAFWGSQQYHYTAPVPGVLALYEALRLICEETLPRRFERHRVSSLALQAGIEAMGLRLFVPAPQRLNSVVAIEVPEGVDGAKVRRHMSEVYNVEISGAFGLNIVRVGQMGEQCRSHNLFKVLYAMGMAFRREGAKLDVAAGLAALEEALGEAGRTVG